MMPYTMNYGVRYNPNKKESRLRDSPPAAGRNMRYVSYPPQCDPRGAFFYVMETKFPIT